MLKCIIVDDEPLALDLLEDNISKVPFLELVGRCRNASEAITTIMNGEIDLVFSDIQMPGMDGIQLIKSLPQKPMFIFITAYESFALDGYSLDIVDYLLKPVSFDRFQKACNKAMELYNMRQKGSKSDEEKNYIFVHIDYSMVKIILDDIVMIEALKDYIKLHFTEGKKSLLVRMSMKAAEDLLPSSKFIRIHKSYIVSINHITAIRKNSLFINKMELPVTEQYKEAIQKLTGQ